MIERHTMQIADGSTASAPGAQRVDRQTQGRRSSAGLWAAPVLLVIAACLTIVYYDLNSIVTKREALVSSTAATGRSAAKEIIGFIDRERDRLHAFVEEKDDLIRRIVAMPQDWATIDELQISVERLFRGAFAFTVTGPDGKPLFDNFDGLVGPTCESSMRAYISADRAGDQVAALPPIHPLPDSYHFDLIAPWMLDSGERGLFFVSMSPARIAELIAAAEEASGHRVVLVNDHDPALIEVAAAGARDQLGGEMRLEPDEWTAGHFAVGLPGTSWRLVVLPDLDALGASDREAYLKTAASVIGLLLISAALLILAHHADRRNSSLFTRSLQSSVSRQRAILQSMADGVIIWGKDGIVENSNAAAARLFGYSNRELIGVRVDDLLPEWRGTEPSPDESDYWHDDVESGRHAGDCDLMARHWDGRLFPVLLRLGESVEQGQHIWVGIVHDRSNKEHIPRQAGCDAKDVDWASVDRQSTRWQEIDPSPASQDGVVRRASGTAGATSSGDPVWSKVSLAALIESVCVDLTDVIQYSGATISVEGDAQVVTDRRQLHQVFWNLLDNAIKFRHSGRPVRVSVSIESVGNSPDTAHAPAIEVRIQDNGIGIHEEQIASVFEGFRRLHPPEHYPGMGLGLSICRKLVHGLGGDIHLSSRLGEGSTFTVVLPSAAS